MLRAIFGHRANWSPPDVLIAVTHSHIHLSSIFMLNTPTDSLEMVKSQVARNLPNTVGTVPKNILSRFHSYYNFGKRLLAWRLARLSKAETWQRTCISTKGLV